MISKRSTFILSIICAISTSQTLVLAHPVKDSYLQSGNPGVLCDGNILPGETEESISYREKMAVSFQRNLGNLAIKKSVTVQFFLTADGFIRDIQVVKPGLNKVETAECVDAALCSSPLPPPPSFRRPLPPAPFDEILPADWYGSGVYQYTFNARSGSISGTSFKLRKIPLELAYRYPQVFHLSDLEAPCNSLLLKDPTCQRLEDLRLQWAMFFSKHPTATKAEVEAWFLRVVKRFLSQK